MNVSLEKHKVNDINNCPAKTENLDAGALIKSKLFLFIHVCQHIFVLVI